MYLLKNQFVRIRHVLSRFSSVKTCSLYGSYAEGRANSESDIDLYIELDYDEVQNDTMAYLLLVHDLESSLEKSVSIVTDAAMSSHIYSYAIKGAIRIYERNNDSISYPYIFSSSFNPASYRDGARLEHIKEALQLIQLWIANRSEFDFNLDLQTASACQRQLQVASGLAAQLTPETKDALVHSDGQWSSVDVLNQIALNFQQYFGVDLKVLRLIVLKNVPEILREISDFSNSWEAYYKDRLARYFIMYFESAINIPLRNEVTASLQWAVNKEDIFETVLAKHIEELTPALVNEGRRNIDAVAAEFNKTGRLERFRALFCPRFPFC